MSTPGGVVLGGTGDEAGAPARRARQGVRSRFGVRDEQGTLRGTGGKKRHRQQEHAVRGISDKARAFAGANGDPLAPAPSPYCRRTSPARATRHP
ncbi:hypothetical protein OG900_35525 [Streptomyces sp. NBC_00433]